MPKYIDKYNIIAKINRIQKKIGNSTLNENDIPNINLFDTLIEKVCYFLEKLLRWIINFTNGLPLSPKQCLNTTTLENNYLSWNIK